MDGQANEWSDDWTKGLFLYDGRVLKGPHVFLVTTTIAFIPNECSNSMNTYSWNSNVQQGSELIEWAIPCMERSNVIVTSRNRLSVARYACSFPCNSHSAMLQTLCPLTLFPGLLTHFAHSLVGQKIHKNVFMLKTCLMGAIASVHVALTQIIAIETIHFVTMLVHYYCPFCSLAHSVHCR